MATEGDNKRIAKNTIFLYFRSFLIMAISIYSSRVVLQVLGIDDYGLYGAIGSIVAMFAMLNGVLAAGTSRFLTFEMGKGDSHRLRETFSASFALHVVMAVIVFLALEFGGSWLLNHKMEIPEGREFAANVVFQLSILTSMLSLTQVPYSASIIAHERMSVYAYVGIAEALFKLALTFVLLYIPFVDTLIAYAVIIACWSIGLQLFYRYYCRKHFEECKLKICREKDYYKSMLSYSIWDFIGQLCSTGNRQGTNILINMFFGVAVNAARAIAYQIENAVTTFSSNFMTSMTPQIVKSYAKQDHKRFFQLIYEGGKYSYYLLFMISLPIFIEADYILSLWLVEVPEFSALFLRCVMAITLFRVIARPLINGVHATGNIKVLNLTSGVYAAVTFLPVLYLLYKFHLPVWYCFVVQGFNAVICTLLEIRALYLQIKFSVVDYLLNVYLIPIMVSALAALIPAVVYFYMPSSFLRLCLTLVISLLSTAICVYTLGINKSVRRKVNNQITRIFHAKFKNA